MKDYMITGYVEYWDTSRKSFWAMFRAVNDRQAQEEVGSRYSNVRRRELYRLKQIDCPEHELNKK